jgi:isoleucyl-tRNA synthetase
VLGAAGKTPAATRESIFMDSYVTLAEPDAARLAKWARIRELRDAVNKEIEVLRADGKLGSSLQANITLTVGPEDHALLASLGQDLKFVFITSAMDLLAGDTLAIQVSPSTDTKCERCWHYRDDVGTDSAHPTLCGRCTSNLYGAGETRTVA